MSNRDRARELKDSLNQSNEEEVNEAEIVDLASSELKDFNETLKNEKNESRRKATKAKK